MDFGNKLYDNIMQQIHYKKSRLSMHGNPFPVEGDVIPMQLYKLYKHWFFWNISSLENNSLLIFYYVS